jgi:hypothetical protein
MAKRKRSKIKRARVYTRKSGRYVKKKVEEVPWVVLYLLAVIAVIWIVFGYIIVSTH